MAWRAASWATCWAANAVLLREPLKPTRPALDQPITLPCMSVIETWVLLKVARMFATPVEMFLAPLALTIFFAFGSSPSNSAAVGAATTGGAASTALASPAAPSAAAFLDLAGAPSPAAALAGFSAAPSFFAAGFFLVSSAFFFSSAILQKCLVNARLRVRITLHTDRLARSLARARIRGGALSTHRQTAQM